MKKWHLPVKDHSTPMTRSSNSLPRGDGDLPPEYREEKQSGHIEARSPPLEEDLGRLVRSHGQELGTKIYKAHHQFNAKWGEILDSCLITVMKGAKNRCMKVGIDELLQSKYPRLSPVRGCVGLQAGALYKIRREIGYWAASPGWYGTHEGEIGIRGPASKKYQQIIQAYRKADTKREFGATAEEDIRAAAMGKERTKTNYVLSSIFSEIVLQPFTAYPKDVRQFQAKQVAATIESAVAEYDRCLRKHWLVATKVADLPRTKLRMGEVVCTIGESEIRQIKFDKERGLSRREIDTLAAIIREREERSMSGKLGTQAYWNYRDEGPSYPGVSVREALESHAIKPDLIEAYEKAGFPRSCVEYLVNVGPKKHNYQYPYQYVNRFVGRKIPCPDQAKELENSLPETHESLRTRETLSSG